MPPDASSSSVRKQARREPYNASMTKRAEAFTTRDRLRRGGSPSPQPPMTPRLITIKQAAQYCSCAVWAIRQAIWSRELRACMIGKRYLIDRGELDAFIDARIRDRAS